MCLLTNVLHNPCSHDGKKQLVIRCTKARHQNSASGSRTGCDNISCEGIKRVDYPCRSCQYRTSIKLPKTMITFRNLDDQNDHEEDEVVMAMKARRERMFWVQAKQVSEVSVEKTRTRSRSGRKGRLKARAKMSLATIEEEAEGKFASDEGSSSDGEFSPKSIFTVALDDSDQWEICTATTLTIKSVIAVEIDLSRER